MSRKLSDFWGILDFVNDKDFQPKIRNFFCLLPHGPRYCLKAPRPPLFLENYSKFASICVSSPTCEGHLGERKEDRDDARLHLKLVVRGDPRGGVQHHHLKLNNRQSVGSLGIFSVGEAFV